MPAPQEFLPLNVFAHQVGVCRQTLAKYVYLFPIIEPSAWANGRALFSLQDQRYVIAALARLRDRNLQ
jgi:hypothetical protein